MNIENEFFVIDSDNLDEAHSRLYGYAVEKQGIYRGDNPDSCGMNFSGSGCYVNVKVDEKSIGNNINLAPLLDPALHQIALTSSTCSDKICLWPSSLCVMVKICYRLGLKEDGALLRNT